MCFGILGSALAIRSVIAQLSLTYDATDLPPDVQQSIQQALPISHAPLKVKIPILLYHYVEYVRDKGDTIRQSLNIEPYILDEQVKTLKDDGYVFLTPSDIPDILGGKTTIPKKAVILTFDDGYRDFYTDVFPILKKYNARGVAYIVTNFIGRPNNLTMPQLEEIAQSNLIEIGAHTLNHAYLKGLPKERVESEIKGSRKELEEKLHISVVSFAYPYGAFDLQTIQAVKDAGFTTAVSTIPGDEINQEDKFFIYRIRPGKRTGKDLLSFLEQAKFDHPTPVVNPIQKTN